MTRILRFFLRPTHCMVFVSAWLSSSASLVASGEFSEMEIDDRQLEEVLGDTIAGDDYLFPNGKVKADGACPPLLFLPFTRGGEDFPHYDPGEKTSLAFSHLSAAVLAMEHFNKRDASVVTEMGDDIMKNCSVYFPLDDFDVADTKNHPTHVAQFLMPYPKAQSRCIILGPYRDGPALEASTLATGLGIPMMSHGAEDNRLGLDGIHPNAIRTSVNMHATGDLVVSALRSKGRTNFLNVLYTSQDYGVQLSETVDNAAKEQGITHIGHHKFAPPFTGWEPGRGLWYAMENIRKTGFRTIFVGARSHDEWLPFLADAAEEFGLIGPEYFWIFAGNEFDINYALYGSNSANVTKLLNGAALLSQVDHFDVDPEEDRFLKSWKGQDAAAVDLIKTFIPIQEGQPGYYEPSDDYFQTVLPEKGSGFMYDAVIAAGMGACWAEANANGSDESGRKEKRRQLGIRQQNQKGDTLITESPPSRRLVPSWKKPRPMLPHLIGIIETKFTGATDTLKYKESKRWRKNRDRRRFTYGLFNFQKANDDENAPGLKAVLTDILTGGGADGVWKQTAEGPFVFADGTSSPPPLLRDVPEQNYLSRGIRIAGLLFMSISLATIIIAVTIVACKSSHNVFRASQPVFLYAFAFGGAVMTISIFTLSWDESYGWTDDMLSAACQATPWLVAVGYIILYCAIFSKLFRINKMLLLRRREKVHAKQVLAPFVALVLAAILVLSLWTALDPLTWERRVVDEQTGESYGSCRSQHAISFMVPLACIMVLSTLLAAIMAWKTKGVQQKFSDSSWIFYTIFTQLQVLLVGIPVIVILNDESTNAAYLSRVLVIWTIPMSTVLLLIGPKVIQVFFPEKEVEEVVKSKGMNAALEAVSVSGLDPPVKGKSSAGPSYEPNSQFDNEPHLGVLSKLSISLSDDSEVEKAPASSVSLGLTSKTDPTAGVTL